MKFGLSFNALNGEIIPDLYSDEYEFDANEYQNGILNINSIWMPLQTLRITSVKMLHLRTNNSLIFLLKISITNQYGCFNLLNSRTISFRIMRLFAFNNQIRLRWLSAYLGLTHRDRITNTQ